MAANMTQPIANFHDARQASVIIREFGRELANRKRLNIANSGSGLAWTNALASGHGRFIAF
jgi:hypothetical protein